MSKSGTAVRLLAVSGVVWLAACGRDRPASSPDTTTALLLAELAAIAPEARIRAAVELGIRRDPAAVRPLVACLADIRLDVRRAAATALGRIGDQTATPALCALVGDGNADPELRRLTARALADLADPRSVPALALGLHDPDEGLAFASAHALASVGEPALGALLEAVTDEKPSTRRAAAGVLGQVPSKRTRDVLQRLLESPDAALRLSAAEGLAQAGHTNAAPGIVSLLTDPSERVRRAVPRVLAQLGMSAAQPLGAVCAMEGDAVNRRDAEGNVVKVPLAPAQQAAAKLLMKLGEPAAIGPLLTARARAKAYAAASLGDLGVAEALPAVEALREDKDPGVRKAAEYAVRKIRGDNT